MESILERAHREVGMDAGGSQVSTNLDHKPNGWRYPQVGGTRQLHFDGTNFKPHKLLENAQTPTSRVHAVLARFMVFQTSS